MKTHTTKTIMPGKLTIMLCIFMLLFSTKISAQDSSKINCIFAPSYYKIVPIFTADSRAHRLSMQKNFDVNNYTASMGGVFPFLWIKKGNKIIQLSAAGSTYLTLTRETHSGNLQNIDFFGDLFCDIKLNKNYQLRLGTGHSSQHMSDDAITSGMPFKNYAKDYHQVLLVYQHTNLARTKSQLIYAGLSYNYNFKTTGDISNKVLLQCGFEHTPVKLRKGHFLYYAADLKWRQELDFAYTTNFQIGYKTMDVFGKTMRIAIDYTKGIDERGYYQPMKRDFFHLGFYFDL